MCELTSQLAACKVCSAENRRLRTKIEDALLTIDTAPVWVAKSDVLATVAVILRSIDDRVA
jgi:hypothetical protein